MEKSKKISWTALDKIESNKSADWFWIVGIIGIGAAVLAIYFNNLIFALLIIISIFAIFAQVNSKPKSQTFEINRKGAVIGEILYTYSSLESFYVIDEDGWDRDRLIFKSKKLLMPLIVMPLGEGSNPDEIRDYLLEYLNEEQIEESFFDRLAILLGL